MTRCMGCGYIPLSHPVMRPAPLLEHRGEVLCAACLQAKRAEDPDDGWYACPEWREVRP